MKKAKNIRLFSWISIIIGILHFIMETWYHFNFEQSMIQLVCDYIGVSLLLLGGFVVLKDINGKGILCGAWGFIFCLNYRAFAWRMDLSANQKLTESMDSTLMILSVTLVFSLIFFMYSLIICYPVKKVGGK